MQPVRDWVPRLNRLGEPSHYNSAGFGAPNTPGLLRYATGGILTGFGGIRAVGCGIGAGLIPECKLGLY